MSRPRDPVDGTTQDYHGRQRVTPNIMWAQVNRRSNSTTGAPTGTLLNAWVNVIVWNPSRNLRTLIRNLSIGLQNCAGIIAIRYSNDAGATYTYIPLGYCDSNRSLIFTYEFLVPALSNAAAASRIVAVAAYCTAAGLAVGTCESAELPP